MNFIRLSILCVFGILCFTAGAQTAGDSMMISRSHQYADSILRAINGHAAIPRYNAQKQQDSAAQARKLLDTINSQQPPSGSILTSPMNGTDTTLTHGWPVKGDSSHRYHRAGADSINKTKWQGNTDGSAPRGKPTGGPPAGYGNGAPAGAGAGGMPANMQSMIQNMKASIGHVYGKVIDGQSHKPISYVSVSLYTMKDSLVTGQLSEDNGDFSFSDLRAGAYNVKVSFIGYKELVNKVIITPAKSEQDVGNLTIVPDAQQLKEVDVTGQKSTVELKVDRKVFNVGNDISSRGGTGLDVMKNIPSVSIDADGNVTLRNNTPQVYIDGKPTTLTLEQIPADQIDKVEVITNPSAKYEAASSGGIINMNIATNTGYNGLALINLKEKKFGVNLMYTINGATNQTHGYNNSTTLNAQNETATYYNQSINTTFKRLFQVARAGFDFYINNRNTLSISENAVFGNFNTDDNISLNGGIPNTLPSVTGTENNNQLNHFRNFTTDLSFKHTYPKEGKEYTLDFQYNHSQGGGNYLYTYDFYDISGNALPMNPTYENLNGGQHADMFTFLGDFSLPIGKNIKIETGFRSNYKLTYSYNNVSNDSTVNGVVTTPEFNYSLSNNYRIDDLVNGAYVTFTHQIKNFSYQLGLRAEEVFYRGTSYLNHDSAFSYQYPTTASSIPKILFPSFNISQKWGTQHELQFNLARKSNRPNFFQIAPFIFSSTATTVQRGNPALQPEFVNQGELNYDLSLSKFSWLSSVYGRYVQQPITSYQYEDNNILVSSYANGTHSVTGGWENTFKIFPVKKLDITLTGNVFYVDIVGGSSEDNAQNAGWSWLGKGIISYKLPLDFTVQVNGTYEAPKILPQGKTVPLYYFDVSLAKDFGFFTLNFTVSDVMNTKASGTVIDQPYGYNSETGTYSGFTNNTSRRRDERYAKLGISFRFGKMDASLFKKKRPSVPDSGGGDMGF
jgi:iron complex outermembrane receptor protein